MKKFFSIIALGAMTLSLSSFNTSDNSEIRDCAAQAWEAGSEAENMGAPPSDVYALTDFVYTAFESGTDYMFLLMNF
jgi:Tfp pilus assembly protein PilV